MNKFTVEDMRRMELTGLHEKLEELRREFFNLKMKRATTGVEKSHQSSSVKKMIAQLQTILTERNRS